MAVKCFRLEKTEEFDKKVSEEHKINLEYIFEMEFQSLDEVNKELERRIRPSFLFFGGMCFLARISSPNSKAITSDEALVVYSKSRFSDSQIIALAKYRDSRQFQPSASYLAK